MQQISCEACGQNTPTYDIVNYGSMDGGYRQLCGNCFNATAAKLAGLKNFEHVRFEPIGMTDARGGTHDFHFRAHLFGDGVALDAFELRGGHPAGYQFQVIGSPEDDLLALLGRLIEKMRRALARTHLEETSLGLQVNDARIVRGRIESDLDDDDRMPAVLIDGRQVTWAELGRMVMTFEGWQFKLEFRDMSEEL